MALAGAFKAQLKNGNYYYRSSITYKNKHISLGSYDTEEKAHAAYKVAKDIIAGKDNPKSQKKQKKNSFNNFEQRKYSDEEMKEIEKALLDLN